MNKMAVLLPLLALTGCELFEKEESQLHLTPVKELFGLSQAEMTNKMAWKPTCGPVKKQFYEAERCIYRERKIYVDFLNDRAVEVTYLRPVGVRMDSDILPVIGITSRPAEYASENELVWRGVDGVYMIVAKPLIKTEATSARPKTLKYSPLIDELTATAIAPDKLKYVRAKQQDAEKTKVTQE